MRMMMHLRSPDGQNLECIDVVEEYLRKVHPDYEVGRAIRWRNKNGKCEMCHESGYYLITPEDSDAEDDTDVYLACFRVVEEMQNNYRSQWN